MKLHHLGHSALLVETAGARLLVDPGSFSVPATADLTDLTAVAITHQHADHVDPDLLASVLAKNADLPVIAEPQTADMLRGHEALSGSAEQITAIAPGEVREVGPLRITAVGGEHAVIHPDIPRVGNTGFVVAAEGEPTLGITGDSLEPVTEFTGVDALAFAMSAPWSKIQETIDFLRAVSPRVALPVHDGILSPQGRGIFVLQVGKLSGGDVEVQDWPESGEIELSA